MENFESLATLKLVIQMKGEKNEDKKVLIKSMYQTLEQSNE
jgi:hypothetical protein